MKNDDAFFAYHSSIIASHPEVHNLSLASFLLTPVQRLPRYMLLLREFTKVMTFYLGEMQWVEAIADLTWLGLTWLDLA